MVVGNLFGNRGPLFYRQPRTGRNGTTFEILKFRTMRACPVDDAGDWTAAHDAPHHAVRWHPPAHAPRRAAAGGQHPARRPLGRRARGPSSRTWSPSSTARSRSTACATSCGPGLTGWAQVKYQYAGTEAETLEKLQYEFFYLRRQSLGLDLRIVGRTARSVVGREGR